MNIESAIEAGSSASSWVWYPVMMAVVLTLTLIVGRLTDRDFFTAILQAKRLLAGVVGVAIIFGGLLGFGVNVSNSEQAFVAEFAERFEEHYGVGLNVNSSRFVEGFNNRKDNVVFHVSPDTIIDGAVSELLLVADGQNRVKAYYQNSDGNLTLLNGKRQ